MHTTKTSKMLFVAATAVTIALGAAGSATATTEPPTDASAAPEAPPVTPGEPSSPEAAAFCEAELAVEAAINGEDPAAIEPAIGAAMEAAPDDVAPLLQAVVDAFPMDGPPGPEFDAAYAEMTGWMADNCGFTQLNVALSEYAFGGIPAELPAGGTIVNVLNTGEEVHEIVVMRFNDDVTMSLEELLALPEEEVFANVTFVGAGFAVPGETSSALLDLTPGRHVAICFLPEGLTAEVFEEAGGQIGPEVSFPPDAVLGAPHFTHGMVQEFVVS